MPRTSQPRHRIAQPRNPERILATLRAQISVSALVAIIVAGFNHEKVSHLAFYTTTVGAGVLTFLVVNYIRTVLLLPPREEDVSQPDPETLTGSITSAVRSTYAISSNWLSLWRSPNFRYYLHLDAAASLIAYSDRFNSYLLRISRDEKDLREFWDEGLQLLDTIAKDDIPVYKHRLRLLIYPEWVYTTYKSEMDQLIQSHSAARIPCIPLVSEELYRCLEQNEHDLEDVADLMDRLGQGFLDKAPPRPALVHWFVSLRLKHNIAVRPSWQIVFPDMLLVDVGVSHDTAAVWWYASNGAITRRGHGDVSSDFSKAEGAFRLICRYARNALWNDYAPGKLGGVAIAASAGGLQSEIFFAREYYGKWLDWIYKQRATEHNASELADWMDAERVLLAQFVQDTLAAQGTNGNPSENGQHTIRLLDMGCGFGRDIIDLLRRNENLHAVGVDIIESNIKEGLAAIYKANLGDRAALFVGDAEALTPFGEREFDIAICMTNTLGNLTPEKQERAVRQLKRILKPTGRAFISVYSEASVHARMTSYGEIGLRVENRGDHIDAAEGLRSQHFTPASLRSLLEKNGLSVVDSVHEVTKIGLAVVAAPQP
jgi:SAM-dependent methyltransferase